MAQGSRSLTLYRWLLELYPRPYVEQHRAEMLQNFEDLEHASRSKAELWGFLARDLALSLRFQLTRSFRGQTAVVVFALTVRLVFAERQAVSRAHLVESCCVGYMLGWFAGWFGKRWSLPAQATIVVTVLLLVITAANLVSGAQNRMVWILCYGFLLAWIAAAVGSRRQTRL